MASDIPAKNVPPNPCCVAWKEKYSKLEERRKCLRQAVNLLTDQVDKIQAENANLTKEVEAEKQKAILLQDNVSEREKEVNLLKGLLDKEKIRADSTRKNAEMEKRKAAEELKRVKAEKAKTDEEMEFILLGAKKDEEHKMQLETLKKEADESKKKLALLTSKLEREKKKFEAEKIKANEERKHVNSKMAKAEEQRVASEANLKKLLEEQSHVENLSLLLEDARGTIQGLQNQGCSESKKVKQLENLKKHAEKKLKRVRKEVKLEKKHNNFLQQQLAQMKLDFVQIICRMNLLDNCFSHDSEGTEHRTSKRNQTSRQKRKLSDSDKCPQDAGLQQDQRLLVKSAPDLMGRIFHHLAPSPKPVLNSSLDSQCGVNGKDSKHTSAMGSCSTSFSNSKLISSAQECDPSDTTSEVLVNGNYNPGPLLSDISNQNPRIVNLVDKKRLFDPIKSIDVLYSEAHNFHMQADKKASILQELLGERMEELQGEQKSSRPSFRGSSNTKHVRKKMKILHGEREAKKQICRVDEDDDDLEAIARFEEVVTNGDYMKLLDLDDHADEEYFRKAIEMPMSPSLPMIRLPGSGGCDLNQFEHLFDESFSVRPTNEEIVGISNDFHVIDLEINSNTFEIEKNINSNVLEDENLNVSRPFGGEAQTLVSSSVEDGLMIHARNELCLEQFGGPTSRAFCSCNVCLTYCSMGTPAENMMKKILGALRKEKRTSPKKKACTFFMLLLHNFPVTMAKDRSLLDRDLTSCLDCFSGQIHELFSDPETRVSLPETFDLDELLGIVGDFLMDGRSLMYAGASAETLNGYESKSASADQLVTGGMILASICAETDRIRFICEASYSLLWMHRCDTAVLLTILHVFGYLGGEKIFIEKYSLTMSVVKAVIRFLEEGSNMHTSNTTQNLPLGSANFPSCEGCLFLDGVVSMETLSSLLLEKLHNLDLLLSSSRKCFVESCSLPSSELGCYDDVKDNSPCILKEFVMPCSSNCFETSFCDLSEVLSLIELLAIYMSWEWTCSRVIPKLWDVFQKAQLEAFAIAIVTLLGQLGRLGATARGYDDGGVENLRHKLSASFLAVESSSSRAFPVELATITAFLRLFSINFEQIIKDDIDHLEIHSYSLSMEFVRKWFSCLSKEQQTMFLCLLQSPSVRSQRDVLLQ